MWFVLVSGLEVPSLNELEFVHGEILANLWFKDKLARIDPHTGHVVGWIDLEGRPDPCTSYALQNQPCALSTPETLGAVTLRPKPYTRYPLPHRVASSQVAGSTRGRCSQRHR